eukprot:11266104-Alexandrium_andersonii.AAC.1
MDGAKMRLTSIPKQARARAPRKGVRRNFAPEVCPFQGRPPNLCNTFVDRSAFPRKRPATTRCLVHLRRGATPFELETRSQI